jgi:Flp pilus assembly protein TadD
MAKKHRGAASAASAPAETKRRLMQQLQRGIALQRAGDFRAAERHYQLVLREVPDQPDALNLMGTIAVEARRFDVSIDYLERAVKLKPKDAGFRNNLANSLIHAMQPGAALNHLRRALKADPRFLEARCNMGRAQRALGKAHDAITAFDMVLTQNPEHVTARIGRAEALIDLGDMDQAAAELRAVLADHPRNTLAFTALCAAHEFTAADSEFDAITHLLETPDLGSLERERLHHAAGKMFNDVGQFDTAFAHYHAAKEIAGAQFSIDRYRAFVDKTIETFTPAFFATRAGFGDDSDRPVFIVGMPRSGTTLTEQIAASHPHVHGSGEITDLQRVATTLTPAPAHTDTYFSDLCALDQRGSRKAAELYLAALKRQSPNARRVTDKTPHNFQLLGLIALLFPRARIVHCRRDPIDTCLSCFMQHFQEAHGYNTNLAKLGLYYREYRRLMDHWRAVLPMDILDMDYEALIADQEPTSRDLIYYLGLEWDNACLSFYETERSVQTPSRWQVRQPIYSSSVKRWKRYEDHLQPLLLSLGDVVDTG